MFSDCCQEKQPCRKEDMILGPEIIDKVRGICSQSDLVMVAPMDDFDSTPGRESPPRQDVQVQITHRRLPAARKELMRRLHGNLKRFQQQAVHGRPCMWISEEEGKPLATQYKMDRELNVLTIGPIPSSASKLTSRNVKVRNIEQMHYFDDGSPKARLRFPPAILSAVDSDQLQQLVLIEYQSEDYYPAKMYLILDPSDDRDSFLDCLRSAPRNRCQRFIGSLCANSVAVVLMC